MSKKKKSTAKRSARKRTASGKVGDFFNPHGQDDAIARPPARKPIAGAKTRAAARKRKTSR